MRALKKDRKHHVINGRGFSERFLGGGTHSAKFTRRDAQEFSPITNQKLTARAIECSTSPLSDDFMTCDFYDGLGTRRTLSNIVFTNYEVKNPSFTNYKRSEDGAIVTRIEFQRPEVCEIMGHNAIGLTMKCGGRMVIDEGGEQK